MPFTIDVKYDRRKDCFPALPMYVCTFTVKNKKTLSVRCLGPFLYFPFCSFDVLFYL